MRALLVASALLACNSAPPRPVVPPPAKATDSPMLAATPAAPPPAAAPAPEQRDRPARLRVVIISEDGMRPDVLDTTHAPNHMALARAGLVAPRAFTVRPSETLCAHASMLSGFGAADHKLTFDGYRKERGQIEVPTIFSVAREHGRTTAMFIAKQKLWHLAPEASVDHLEKPGFFCKVVAERAASYFETKLPDLMFVHIADPDNAGHESGWMTPQYMTAVKESDRCLGVILAAIERSGMAGSTVVIVTADHGGSGRSHSGRGKELDRKIPWFLRGPAIPGGSVLAAEVHTQDTAATALSALELPTRPGMAGVSWYPPPANMLRSSDAAAFVH